MEKNGIGFIQLTEKPKIQWIIEMRVEFKIPRPPVAPALFSTPLLLYMMTQFKTLPLVALLLLIIMMGRTFLSGCLPLVSYIAPISRVIDGMYSYREPETQQNA